MIKIKNKIYNSKAQIKQRRFNSYMNYKEFLRFKLSKFIPLNEKEINVYTPIKFKNKIINIDKDKFFFYNKRIHILSAINKNDLKKFYAGYCSLVKEHPSTAFGSAIIDTKTIKMLEFYQNSSNSLGKTNLGLISPNHKDLLGIVDHIKIMLFGLSDNYVGVTFILFLNEDFNKELNQLIISEPSSEVQYNKFRIGNDIHINKNILDKNDTRRNKLNDILLEVKIRSYNFLKSYFELLPINDNSPITLDEYSTNYCISEKNLFLETYNFYPYKEHIHKNLDVTVYLTEDHKTKRKFVKNNFLFQCSHSSENNTNRSAKILYEFTEEYTDNYIDSFDFTNLYTNILQFYINIELDQCILKKNQILYDTYKNNVFIFKKYIIHNRTINIYHDILSSIHEDDLSYNDTSLHNTFLYQQELYKKIIKKNKSLDTSFSNLIMFKNNRLSLFIATVSTIIALISLIVGLFF